MSQVRVRTVIFSGGERYPMLLDEHGQPNWHSTLFVTTQVRNASKAPNTTASILGTLKLLLAWGAEHSVDIEQRFLQRSWLTGTEIESIRNYIQRRAESKDPARQVVVALPRRREHSRAAILASGQQVSSRTTYIRMTYVGKYLEWLANQVLEHETSPSVGLIRNDVKAMLADIRSRRPKISKHSQLRARRGLTAESRAKLFDITHPDSPGNPFEPDVRLRNWLIVKLLDALGIRVGELLALKVFDFDFQGNEVLIRRQHGDPEDSRPKQPVAKTLDRRLPLSSELIDLVHRYVITDRQGVRPAKRHPFLLIVHQRGVNYGRAMSYSALSKVMRRIREAAQVELEGLSGHVLRHTANERLSDQWDVEGISDAKEEKMRSYMMGWKEGSGTAATYTRRHTERRAREAQLKLQDPENDGRKRNRGGRNR